jgi:hypothetical protein
MSMVERRVAAGQLVADTEVAKEADGETGWTGGGKMTVAGRRRA